MKGTRKNAIQELRITLNYKNMKEYIRTCSQKQFMVVYWKYHSRSTALIVKINFPWKSLSYRENLKKEVRRPGSF